MKNKTLITTLCFLAGCSDPGVSLSTTDTTPSLEAFNISDVAGKSRSSVEEILGDSLGCDDVSQGTQCRYSLVETEIVFIDGLADWITIEGIDSLTFGRFILNYFGLEPLLPSFETEYVLRWEPYEDYRSISAFAGVGSKADYLYIKVFTE